MIATDHLTKRYGTLEALADVDLRVEKGSIYGLVGPNGSGKTTALEILVGLRRPESGTVRIDAETDAIAYCPDVPEFEPWLTAIEVLEVAGGLLGQRKARAELTGVLERVGLCEVANRRVGDFSRGMSTRLNLAAALVSDPKVILLDEPASALDPAGQVEMLDIVADLAGKATVLMSSHDLGDVERICHDIGILSAGHLIYQGSLANLLESHAKPRWSIVVRTPADALVDALRSEPWVSSVIETTPGVIDLHALDSNIVERELPRLLAENESRLVTFERTRLSLEEVFLALTGASPTSKSASS